MLGGRLTIETIQDQMVFVEGGKYLTTRTGYGRPEYDRTFSVELRSFFICRYPVTQELWETVMDSNPSRNSGRDNPVDQVTFLESLQFCNELSKKKELPPYYIFEGDLDDESYYHDSKEILKNIRLNPSSSGYRLPTEAEWEYAGRGGIYSCNSKYAGSNVFKEVAWTIYNSNDHSKPVGLLRSNELGLFDMSGNVMEWCWCSINDTYRMTGEYLVDKAVPIPPFPPSPVVKGGSYIYNDDVCRLEVVESKLIDKRDAEVGFRICRQTV